MESTIWPTLPKFDPTKDRYVRPFSSTPLISSSRSRQGLSGSAHPLRWTLYRGSPTTSNPGREALGARCPAVIGIANVLWSPEGLDGELSAYPQPGDLADLDDGDGTDSTASFQERISSRAREGRSSTPS